MRLAGLKGASAWQVYNKVIFHLPFIRANNHHRREFARHVAGVIQSGQEGMEAFLLTLSDPDIPSFRAQADCLADFKATDLAERTRQLLECLIYVSLSDDELLRLLACHTNARGIPYSRATVEQLTMAQILPMALETLLTASLMDVDLSMITSKEMDALDGHRLDIRAAIAGVLSAGPGIPTDEAIAIAAKQAFEGVPIGRS